MCLVVRNEATDKDDWRETFEFRVMTLDSRIPVVSFMYMLVPKYELSPYAYGNLQNPRMHTGM